MSKNKKISIAIGISIVSVSLVVLGTFLLQGSSQTPSDTTPISTSTSNTPVTTENTVPDEGSLINQDIKQKLNLPNKSVFTQYHYSPSLKLAFTYENQFIGDKKDLITIEELENTIFVYPSSQNRDSADIVTLLPLINPSSASAEIESIIKDTLSPEFRLTCRPQINQSKSQENSQIYELISTNNSSCEINSKQYFALISHETKELSRLISIVPHKNPITYDGSNQGKYWYQSIIIE